MADAADAIAFVFRGRWTRLSQLLWIRSLLTSSDAAVVKATIQLVALDIPVTAEGMETEPQPSLAHDAGCELLQGYLIGRPMSFGHLVNELPDDADKRPLRLRVSVIAHHVEHGVDNRAYCVCRPEA